MSARAYLDWNATAPLRPAARAAMIEALDAPGNPSSVHAEGRGARAAVERARASVAGLAGCAPEQVTFTSGASEAAATVLSAPWRRVLCTPVEHDCIDAHRGSGWETLALGRGGALDPATLAAAGPGPGDLVVVQAANSETGILQPVAEIGALAARAGAALLVDAVQAAGKVALADAGLPGGAFVMLSAHKIGGPKGVGALVQPAGADLPALIPGGGQERGRRAGTENVAAIAGFGAAARAAQDDLEAGVWARVANLRKILERTLAEAVAETTFFGQESPRLPNTSCFAVPGWKGETQVMQMDLAGFAVSAGSACSSGKVRESRVLRALGADAATAASAIRVSLGPDTTAGEVADFAGAWTEQHRRRRSRAA